MMISAAHFINRQHNELSDNLQNFAAQLIRQSAYTLGPLIHSYNTDGDNSRQIALILEHMSQQPWIVDIAAYQLNGALIARAGEDVDVKQRLRLESADSISDGTVQLVEKIDLAESPVGFIRMTLNPKALETATNAANYTTKMIWFILLLSVALGAILALTLRKWRILRYSTDKRREVAELNEMSVEADSEPQVK